MNGTGGVSRGPIAEARAGVVPEVFPVDRKGFLGRSWRSFRGRHLEVVDMMLSSVVGGGGEETPSARGYWPPAPTGQLPGRFDGSPRLDLHLGVEAFSAWLIAMVLSEASPCAGRSVPRTPRAAHITRLALAHLRAALLHAAEAIARCSVAFRISPMPFERDSSPGTKGATLAYWL